jgi:hypothetical protein
VWPLTEAAGSCENVGTTAAAATTAGGGPVTQGTQVHVPGPSNRSQTIIADKHKWWP